MFVEVTGRPHQAIRQTLSALARWKWFAFDCGHLMAIQVAAAIVVHLIYAGSRHLLSWFVLHGCPPFIADSRLVSPVLKLILERLV